MTNAEPGKIEEIIDEPVVETPADGDDSDDAPDLEHVPEQPAAGEEDAEEGTTGKKLKKAQKIRRDLKKLGLKPLPGYSRITMKKGKIIFIIPSPEVYRIPNSDTFIILGESRIEDYGATERAKAAAAIAEKMRGMQAQMQPKIQEIEPVEEEPEEEEEEGTTDAKAEEDIKLVMMQGKCSRAAAKKALKEKGDVIDAIVHVSSAPSN